MNQRISSAVFALALGLVPITSTQAQHRGFSKGPQFGNPAAPRVRASPAVHFNPKEITIKKPVPWQKSKSGPKTITTCVTPGGRRVRC
jgi:hypothetical protein